MRRRDLPFGLLGSATLSGFGLPELARAQASNVREVRRSLAEIAAGINPTDPSRLDAPYDVRRVGALLDGSTDDTSALRRAIAVSTAQVGGAVGGSVMVPTGTSMLSQMVTLPNRVRVLGENKRGSCFRAGRGHPGPWMFNAKNENVAMFDSTLENVTVDASNVPGLGCVLSDAWQEDCGLRGVLLRNFTTTGIRYQHGYGGAALSRIVDTEIFGGRGGLSGTETGFDGSARSSETPLIGIDVQQISSVGAFMLDVSDSTIAGSAFPLDKGINVANDSLHCRNVHFEVVRSAIYLSGVGHTVLIGVTGASTIANLVEIDASWRGTLTMIGCIRNGSGPISFLRDNRAGGVGTVTGLDYPFFHLDGSIARDVVPIVAPGANWSAGCFDGTVDAPTLKAGFNVSSITKNGIGDYTIAEGRSRPSAASAPWVMSNLSGATYRTDLVSDSSYRLRIFVGDAPTDSNEVKFGNIRLL